MSAMLCPDDLQPVADLIERLLCVQAAIRDLHEVHDEHREFCVTVTMKGDMREVPVSHTHTQSYWVVLQGLAAMERELRQQLVAHDIDVESVLPIAEVA